MPSALSGVTSSLPWGQSKKTEGTSGTGSTPTQPVTTETPPTQTTEPTSEPMPTEGASDPAAKTYSAPTAANDVSPMPDRLRDLIVQQSSQAAPMSTSLHTLVLRGPEPSPAAENPLAFDQVQRTRAQIIAQASVSLVAQANHTGDSVRALLGAAA